MTGAWQCSTQYFVTEPMQSLDIMDMFFLMRMTPAGATSSTYWQMAAPMLALSGVPACCTFAATTDAPPEEALGMKTSLRKCFVACTRDRCVSRPAVEHRKAFVDVWRL